MNLVKNIRENFATLLMGNYSVIRELDPEYIGYTLYLPEGYAVAIEFDSDLNINEKFSNSKLFSRKLNLDGTLKNSKNEITEKTRKALIQAQKMGIKVVLASGRPNPGLRH